ncbi:MAG: glycosyltransferase family A protein [Solirubrobacteraceae bacterium]
MAAEVSVIVPARDREPFLGEAIASALAQGEAVREVLVCTARSDSASAREAGGHDARVRAVRSGGGELHVNLNAGLRTAACEWLAFLDADDVWAPGRITAGLDAFARIPGLEVCFGRQLAIAQDGGHGAYPADGRLLGTTLMRRVTADAVGPFAPPSVTSAMQWLLRAGSLGLRSAMLTDVLLHRRVHTDNMTRRDQGELHAAYLRLARESLDRHRRGQ